VGGLPDQKQPASQEDEAPPGHLEAPQTEEWSRQAHDPGDGEEKQDPDPQGQRQSEPAGQRLLRRGQPGRQNGEEDDVVDAEHDLHHGQGRERDEGVGGEEIGHDLRYRTHRSETPQRSAGAAGAGRAKPGAFDNGRGALDHRGRVASMTPDEPARDPGGSARTVAPLDLEALCRQVGVSTTGRTSRFIAYAHLLDACAKPGCPVCRCLIELATKALDILFHEHVTDRETRDRLDRSGGFCAWHGQLAVQGGGSALGTAIVYESVLRRAVTRLRDLERAQAGRGAAPWWSPRAWRPFANRGRRTARETRATRCPPCVLLADSEADYLRTVLDSSGSEEFDAAYAESGGLCLPHLDLALAASRHHPGCGRLVAATLAKVEGLTARLARFVDKHDHRADAAFAPEEAAAWTDVVEVVAGSPGLFGNQIPRTAGSPDGVGPNAATGAAPGSDALATAQVRLDALAFENRRLTERVAELIRDTGDESTRAAGLDYRLRLLTEDRRVLELNLAGERGAARTWERQVRELEAEVAGLRRRLGLDAGGPDGPAPA
jgi:hypothetical protein